MITPSDGKQKSTHRERRYYYETDEEFTYTDIGRRNVPWPLLLSLAAETPAETTKTVSVSRQELAPYRDSMKENCDVLKNLMISNRELSTKVKEAQKELKQSGALTDEINAELKEMSQLIQAQRVSLTEKREAVIALRASGKESAAAKDTEATKSALEQVIALQADQISLQEDLSKLLEEKLALFTAE